MKYQHNRKRITAKAFQQMGGLSNPKLFRTSRKGGGWVYWERCD
jgi:hypothetical protein